MWAALLLAVCLCHMPEARRFVQKEDIFSQIYKLNYSVDLAQFLDAPFIWTVFTGTRDPGGSTYNVPSYTCQSDEMECVTIKDVIFQANYTDNGPRKSRRYYGAFLNKTRKPTSMLLLDPDDEVIFYQDILVYSSPNNTCGLFYTIKMNSPALRDCIKNFTPSASQDDASKITPRLRGTRRCLNYHKLFSSPQNTTDIAGHFKASVPLIQCHVKVPGNSTRPNTTDQCQTPFENICKDFLRFRVYNGSCPNLVL